MRLQKLLRNLVFTILLVTIYLPTNAQTVSDFDGNIYQTVTIGNQTWMAENLKTTHYSDGTAIEDGTPITILEYNDTTKRYYYYNDNPAYFEEYGLLYNWFTAVNGSIGSNEYPSGIQGICPTGWHIPSIEEWNELIEFVGDSAAYKLKQTGSTGFNVQFGGCRAAESFGGINTIANYITSDNDADCGFECKIRLELFFHDNPEIVIGRHEKNCGYSLRCVKDTTDVLDIRHPDRTNIKVYPNPCNNFVWIESTDLDNATAFIHSIDGKLIRTIKLNSGKNHVKLNNLLVGVYLLEIVGDNFHLKNRLIRR